MTVLSGFIEVLLKHTIIEGPQHIDLINIQLEDNYHHSLS